MSYGRDEIADRLEPAARDLIAAIDDGAVKRDDPDEIWAKVATLHEVIDDLDAYDNESDRKRTIASEWTTIERDLRRLHPVTEVEPRQIAPRCTANDRAALEGPGRAGCSLRGKWTYDGLAGPGCKPHVEKKRDRGIAAIRLAAWNELDPPPDGVHRHYSDIRPKTIEIVRAVADKLGVAVPA